MKQPVPLSIANIAAPLNKPEPSFAQECNFCQERHISRRSRRERNTQRGLLLRVGGREPAANGVGIAVAINDRARPDDLQISGLAIADELLDPTKKDKLINGLKEAHAEALKKMQRTIATKMQSMGGFNLPGMN